MLRFLNMCHLLHEHTNPMAATFMDNLVNMWNCGSIVKNERFVIVYLALKCLHNGKILCSLTT